MPAPLALIIEDEYLIASDVANGLTERGFQVACVASERAAATWLDENRPDLAIIDIQLLDGQKGLTAAR
jgi:DNA-binding response OmpR family regulator